MAFWRHFLPSGKSQKKNVNLMLSVPDQKGQTRPLGESHPVNLMRDRNQRMFPSRRERKRLLSFQKTYWGRKKTAGVPHRCYQGKKDARQLFQNSFPLDS